MNVILIEDDPSIGRLVSRGLSARGYQVRWERRGAPAFDLLSSGDFSVAVLDLGLPDGDGLALCRALRQADVSTPVLMLTARAELDDKLKGFEAGADDYLPKPFAFEELAARVGVLAKRKAVPSNSRTLGSLTIDPLSRTASVTGVALRLPPKEFDVLEKLVAGKGAFVSRVELISGLWDDLPSAANILDVHIRLLRGRLASHAGAPRIVTKRGVGYRLE
jgi:DNA-binding response OmpR family regulator